MTSLRVTESIIGVVIFLPSLLLVYVFLRMFLCPSLIIFIDFRLIVLGFVFFGLRFVVDFVNIVVVMLVIQVEFCGIREIFLADLAVRFR